MKRGALLNGILGVLAFILFVAVLMQTGLFGSAFKVSRLVGIEKEAVSLTADDFVRCKVNGGTITLQIPRLCQNEGKSYYESYASANEVQYRTEVENEAAQLGKIIVAPANKATLNAASYETIQKSIVSYASKYASNDNGITTSVLIMNTRFKGVSDADIASWKALTHAKEITEIASVLGGNTATVTPTDLSAKGLSKAVVFVDGEGERVLGTYSVLVAGEVRDNFVLMQAPLTIDNFANMISDCLKANEVVTAQDKDIAAQACLNKKVADTQAIQTSVQTIVKKLGDTFSFSL